MNVRYLWYRLLGGIREYRSRCPLLPKWEGVPFFSGKTPWQMYASCDFPDLRKRLLQGGERRCICIGKDGKECVLRHVWVEGVNERDSGGNPVKINIVQARNSALSSRYDDDKALWEERINRALRTRADTRAKEKWMYVAGNTLMSFLREVCTSLKKVSWHKYAG